MRAPLFLVPLRVEELLVRRGAPGAAVCRIGMGPVPATAARVRLAPSIEPGQPVVLIGIGGGLRAGQRPGDVVVASEVSGLDSDETLELRTAGEVAELLTGAGLRGVVAAPIVSSARIVHGEGRAKAAARGAAAVDMESLWCAPLARVTPFAVVRVLVDVPAAELSVLARPAALYAAGRALARAAGALGHWSPRPADATASRARGPVSLGSAEPLRHLFPLASLTTPDEKD